MKSNMAVAYLDLLGFKNYTNGDPAGALMLLDNYQIVLKSKLIDDSLMPAKKYPTKNLQKLAAKGSISSFDTILPFSDSMFFTSNNLTDFIAQLSTFLIESFLFVAQEYVRPTDQSNPTKVITSVNSSVGMITSEENWFPPLFRGGVSYGEVFTSMTAHNKVEGVWHFNSPLLSGKAVSNAVILEGSGKGPRVYCDKNFRAAVGKKKVNKYIVELQKGELFEILWPAFIYIESNENETELQEFDKLFVPAVRLWKAYNHKEYGSHYYEFMRLIIKSTLVYFSDKNYQTQAENYISKVLEREGISDKINDLLAQ